MKTVLAVSRDGSIKRRVPIEVERGPFCLARAGLFKKGGKLCWAVYHTRSGRVMGDGFRRKRDALTLLQAVANMKGDWNRPVEAIRKDSKLVQAWANAYSDVMCKLGIWKKIS